MIINILDFLLYKICEFGCPDYRHVNWYELFIHTWDYIGMKPNFTEGSFAKRCSKISVRFFDFTFRYLDDVFFRKNPKFVSG